MYLSFPGPPSITSSPPHRGHVGRTLDKHPREVVEGAPLVFNEETDPCVDEVGLFFTEGEIYNRGTVIVSPPAGCRRFFCVVFCHESILSAGIKTFPREA